jgi:hypothetical protein
MIDQHIPAGDNVNFRKWRVADYIMIGKTTISLISGLILKNIPVFVKNFSSLSRETEAEIPSL